eukprot:1115478-Heterocapsa_arctica.AAC.1
MGAAGGSDDEDAGEASPGEAQEFTLRGTRVMRGRRTAAGDELETGTADPVEAVTAPAAAPSRLPEAAWRSLDQVDLEEEARHRVRTLQSPPNFMRGAVRGAFQTALERIDATRTRSAIDHERAWKLFVLVPRLLFYTPEAKGRAGRREIDARMARWHAGDFQ